MRFEILKPLNDSPALLLDLTAETPADRLFLGRVAQQYKFKPGSSESPANKIVVDLYNIIARIGFVTAVPVDPEVTEVLKAKALAGADGAAYEAAEEKKAAEADPGAGE